MNLNIIIALLKLRGVGRQTVYRLAAVDTGASDKSGLEELINKGKSAHMLHGSPSPGDIQAAFESAQRELDLMRQKKVHALGFSDLQFPENLRKIPDPPALLYVRGLDCGFSEKQAVAIVGTRDPTDYGRKVAERAAYLFAEHGFIVASGLAEGCDTHAHKGCLAAKGKTVAVMAHGLQMIYPRSNARLAEDIVENGGALVSEYAWGMKPERRYFVERDRLQSGLSDAVVVVETDVSGGTMHTVNACLRQGRMLVCIGHPESLQAKAQVQGNRMLLRAGKARCMGSPEEFKDIVTTLRACKQKPAREQCASFS